MTVSSWEFTTPSLYSFGGQGNLRACPAGAVRWTWLLDPKERRKQLQAELRYALGEVSPSEFFGDGGVSAKPTWVSTRDCSGKGAANPSKQGVRPRYEVTQGAQGEVRAAGLSCV